MPFPKLLAQLPKTKSFYMATFPKAAKRFFPGPPALLPALVPAAFGEGVPPDPPAAEGPAGEGSLGLGDGVGAGFGCGFPFFCSYCKRCAGFAKTVPGTTFVSLSHW